MITDDTGCYTGVQTFQAFMLPNGRALLQSAPLGLCLTMLPNEASTLGNLLLAVSSWSAADPVMSRQATAAEHLQAPLITEPPPSWVCEGCGVHFFGPPPNGPGNPLCQECAPKRESIGYPPPLQVRSDDNIGRPENIGRLVPAAVPADDADEGGRA